MVHRLLGSQASRAARVATTATVRKIAAGATMLMAALLPMSATADSAYPSRTIRIVSPFPPGGGTDFVARQLASKLNEANGWTVIVDNKAGAGGTVGLADVARAQNEGYDLVVGQKDNLILSPWLMKVPFDTVRDFTPIGLIGTTPIVFLVPASSPFKTFEDVVKASRERPGTLTLGSSGNGSVSHIAGELLQAAANFKIQHIPYKGSTPALVDLIGGHVDVVGSSIASASSQLKAGKVRALAVSTAKRNSALPDVPTIAELGYKDFDVTAWWGLLGPAGMPEDVVKRLNGELARFVQRPEVLEAFRNQGVEAQSNTPAEFATWVKDDYLNWKDIIARTGVKTE
jgi:tripartite-type tricarboxylate transporter receptor subunit TctC